MAGGAQRRLSTLAAGIGPWLAFLALLLSGWRVASLTHALPAYGDTLEVVWTLQWYADAVRGAHDFLVYPSVFFPVGWHVATFATGPVIPVVLLPLDWLGGPAFAYNVMTLLTFVLAFAGMHLLARRFLDPLPAAVAALAFTFWGFRWFRIAGHLNILLASALLPWFVWTIERAMQATRRRAAWWAMAGVQWAIMIACSWYFVWMGGILLLVWVAGRWLVHLCSRRVALTGLLVSTAIALVLSVPLLVWFVRESTAIGISFYSIEDVSKWDASLNSLAIPAVSHPWLRSIAKALYQGPVNEPGQVNLGLLASLLAILGLRPGWRDRRWRPVLVLTGVGLLLALGLTLKWNGTPVQSALFRPLNDLTWQAGHWLKPGFFLTAQPPKPFAEAVPLPGMILSALVPFWERARVFSRYGLLLGLGHFMLAALGLSQVRRGWMRALLAGILLFEVIPAPSQSLPFPPPSHPAFDWLRQQDLHGGAILDLGSWQQDLAYMPIGGDTLWATEYHGQPAVAGASSVWPPHVVFLDRWLAGHPHPFEDPEFVPLLRQYSIGLVVLHITGGYAEEMLAEARPNPELEDMHCFTPLEQPGPWSYPICIARVTESTHPAFNVLFGDGWSGMEAWGRWSAAGVARAEWVAMREGAQSLSTEMFPVCVPGRAQRSTIEVNGAVVADHQWTGCEPWAAQITIPAGLSHVGTNEILLRSAFVAQPDGDSRDLALGVNRLLVTPTADDRRQDSQPK